MDLLNETGMLGCKHAPSPIDQNQKIGKNEKAVHVDRERYQRLVGKLIYLSHTRPNIAFVVSVVSQYMHTPFEEHLEAVHGILRYLKVTPRKGLILQEE